MLHRCRFLADSDMTTTHRTAFVLALSVATAVAPLGGCESRGHVDRLKPTNAVAAPTQNILEVTDEDFPRLIIYKNQSSSNEQPNTPTASCTDIRAARLSELKDAWRAAIEHIAFTCKQEPGDDDPNPTAVATLRAGAVTMHGLPLVEFRASESGDGGTWEYVLAGSFAEHGQALLAKIVDECLTYHSKLFCKAPTDYGNSVYLQTNELGGIILGEDENDSQRIVYSKVQSE
jgi:hypothetical protein